MATDPLFDSRPLVAAAAELRRMADVGPIDRDRLRAIAATLERMAADVALDEGRTGKWESDAT